MHTFTFSLALTTLTVSSFAQSAHSRLTDKGELERFDRISRKVMCTCGCNMPLKYCNHTGHCNAWPARDAIDQLIRLGKSDAQIIEGFKSGFGKEAAGTAVFAMARTPEYAYMLEKFESGFGSTILSSPESSYLGWISIFAALTILGVVVIYIRHRSGKQTNPQADQVKPVSGAEDARHRQLLQSLQNEEID